LRAKVCVRRNIRIFAARHRRGRALRVEQVAVVTRDLEQEV